MMTPRLSNKIALITGASRGLGAAVAKRFAKEGAQLILVARSTADLEGVDNEVQRYGPPAVLAPFDLSNLPLIDELALSLAQRFGHLDILVGNAAILGGLGPLTHLKANAWHQIMTTNLHVNWHLLKALDPLLCKTSAGRVLFVTSEVGTQATPYWGAYGVSKAALEMMAKIYAAESAHRGTKVNLIDPGSLKTTLYGEGGNPTNLTLPEDITEVFVQAAEESCPWQGETIHAQR